jgi:COP9 signalosome complex subunit 5
LDQQLLELLWNKYWVNTLSSLNLDQKWMNLGKQVDDLAGKTKIQAERLSAIHSDKMDFKSDGTHGPLSKIVADR